MYGVLFFSCLSAQIPWMNYEVATAGWLWQQQWRISDMDLGSHLQHIERMRAIKVKHIVSAKKLILMCPDVIKHLNPYDQDELAKIIYFERMGKEQAAQLVRLRGEFVSLVCYAAYLRVRKHLTSWRPHYSRELRY